MAIYSLGELVPKIDPTAYISPDAVIIGDVIIGAESSIWPGAVLRGDDGGIFIGERTSIQDGTVVHTTPMFPTRVGNDCVVGHIVHLEGCVIHDGALVGSGSVVLHNAQVHSGAIVGANAVVPNQMVVPAGSMALGVPAKIRPDAADSFHITAGVEFYVQRGKRYAAELKRLD